ncbi:MAG: hypothetical protein AB1491_09160 [Thermodesulfobacteriota bacterium]
MQHFEAGFGWEGQVRHLVRKKYREDLAGLAGLESQPLARLLRGELVGFRPYATIQWVMRLVPFRPLEIYILYDFEPEFGSDLRVLYARKSLAVPTEDAYVFAWDYLALLARYGRGAFALTDAGPGSDWLTFSDFAPPAASPMKEVSLKPREELLRQVSLDLVEVALARLDCGVVKPWGQGWEVIWPLLGDLSFRLRQDAGGLEVAFDSHGARKYGPEFLMSFAWLYINALLRECRQVEPSLPRLSRWL